MLRLVHLKPYVIDKSFSILIASNKPFRFYVILAARWYINDENAFFNVNFEYGLFLLTTSSKTSSKTSNLILGREELMPTT